MKKLFLLITATLFAYNVMAQEADTTNIDVLEESPTVIVLDTDYDESSVSSNDVSTLLHSSLDVFSKIASFQFGQMHFSKRGNDAKYADVLINGIRMNDCESGRAVFSMWGGLNDAMRNSTVIDGLGISEACFGNIGGSTNISTRASLYRPQWSVSYANSNRSYHHRVMASYATGMNSKGWALMVAASGRLSHKGFYIEGTFFRGVSYFVSGEKRFNDKHSLNLTVFAAPTEKGGASPVVQEAFDLVGTNFYNPNWGYQTQSDGKLVARNARINTTHQPVFQLTHYWTPTNKTSLTTTAYYLFGKNGQTTLEWGEAPDPRPDYYRNLPSYYLNNASSTQEYLDHLEAWQNQDPSVCQINWDALYMANVGHLVTVNNANGTEGNSITGIASKYIIAERHRDKNQGGLATYLKHDFKPNLHLFAGLNFNISKTHYYEEIYDLLGGDFYVDINKYADNFESDEYQTNLLNTNHVAYKGDIFNYDYIANRNYFDLWATINYNVGHFDMYAGLSFALSDIWRFGNYKTGAFANNSYGTEHDRTITIHTVNGDVVVPNKEQHNTFLEPGVKGGVTYAINGRNYISANVSYQHHAPGFSDIYVSPRTRNTLVTDNIKTEKVFATDLSYQMRYEKVRMKLAGYYNRYSDLIWNRSFYCENVFTGSSAEGNNYKSEYVNFVMTDIKQKSIGVEFGFEWDIISPLTLQLAATHGTHVYTNRPLFSVYDDNTATAYISNEPVYLKNYHVAGGPETAVTLGLRYNSPYNFWISVNGNYFDNMFFDVNPYNHTEYGMTHYSADDIRVPQALNQSKLDNQFTLDLSAGYSRTFKGYNVAINLNMCNLTNNKKVVLYGFEQLRFNANDPEMFPNKYTYLQGINYFVSVTVRH